MSAIQIAVSNLSAAVRAAMQADGAAAYEGESALKSFADAFRPTMATATQPGDFAAFSALSYAWRVGYEAERRNVTVDDVLASLDKTALSDRSQDAFERRIKAAKSEDALGGDRLVGDKPKSVNPESVAKAEARAKDAERLAALAANKTPVQLAQEATLAEKAAQAERERAAKLAAQAEEAQRAAQAGGSKGKRAEAKAAALAAGLREAQEKAVAASKAAHDVKRAADLRAKAVAKAAEDAARERTKSLREQLRELMKDADDRQLVAAIAAIKAKAPTKA